MTLEERKAALVDPHKWDAIWHNAYRFFEAESPHCGGYTRWAILEPLEAILQEEHAKNGFSDVHTMGLCFLVTTRKAAGPRPQDGDPAEPMREIYRAWEDWHKAVACIAQAKSKKFDDGPKHERLDALGREILVEWQAFVEKHGRAPSAVKLREAMPSKSHCIQEKVFDGEERTIYWRRPNGSEATTSNVLGSDLQNKPLLVLQIREKTGCSVIAVYRGDRVVINPDPQVVLEKTTS